MGDFQLEREDHAGVHVPLITGDLWQRVQEVLDQRVAKRHRKVEDDVAFSRLIACGHCGCSLVGEIKKGRYIYYYCTGFKGKGPEPYRHEEVLEERLARLRALGKLGLQAYRLSGPLSTPAVLSVAHG